MALPPVGSWWCLLGALRPASLGRSSSRRSPEPGGAQAARLATRAVLGPKDGRRPLGLRRLWGLGGAQGRLGLSPRPPASLLRRLQCGRCQWGWASAHVHVLFHLWWDEAGRHGLVKMRVWGQQCRLCPPGGAECRVSLLNVWLFLGKLVRFIAHKCYAEGPGSDQGPRSASGSAGGPAPRGFASSSSRLTPPEGPRAGAPAV